MTFPILPLCSGQPPIQCLRPYHAAKFGVLAISESLAGELAGTSIGVSMICCGWVRGTKGAYASRNRPKRYGAATEISPAATTPAAHRPVAMRFGQDLRVVILSQRSLALWTLGHPEAALADIDRALKDAREIDQTATLMYALVVAPIIHIHCGNYVAANALCGELLALAAETGSSYWRAFGTAVQGCGLALTSASDAVQVITSGLTAWRSTGATLFLPWYLSSLAKAYAELGQFDNAWHCIGEAMVETTKETWFEADVHRIAGDIALRSTEPNTVKAEVYFERALAVARQKQAKSWELRAAMSLARLWRDQGKRDEARELLAPVYGWFTEGFDTLDLKEAKALLDELAACEHRALILPACPLCADPRRAARCRPPMSDCRPTTTAAFSFGRSLWW